MANYFKLLKPKQAMLVDKILFGVGGLAHLLPDVLAPVTGLMLGPISVQMLVGGLMVARLIDMLMK